MVKVFLREIVGSVESIGGVGFFTRWARALWQINAGALSEEFDRLHKGDSVDFLKEFEYIASNSTAEAMIDLAVGVDTERWRFLVMERAEPKKIPAFFTQMHVFGDHVYNVGGVANALENVFGYAWHC